MAAASPPDSEAAVAVPPSGAPGPASEQWFATHVWRLDSFSTLWTRGKKHLSDVFYVGGCPWRLSLYPKGNTAVKGSRDNVAIYLEAADFASAPVGYKRYCDFRLGVVTQKPADGGVDKSVWRSGAHEFNSETSDGTWGFSQFITVASLYSTPGLIVDDQLVVHGEVTLRWKRGSLADAAPTISPPQTLGLPAAVGVDAGSAASASGGDGASTTEPVVHGHVATGLELPPAMEAAYTRLVGCPDRAGAAVGGVLARALAAQPPVGAAPSVLAVPEETALWHRALAGLRTQSSLALGVTHPSWAGAWAVPLWRTLQQVHSGASMHWQTLALVEGVLTDVLLRLCRAAHDVSAGTAGPSAGAGGTKEATGGAAAAAGTADDDDSDGESEDEHDDDGGQCSSDEGQAGQPTSPAPAPPAAGASAAGPPASVRLAAAELVLFNTIGGPTPPKAPCSDAAAAGDAATGGGDAGSASAGAAGGPQSPQLAPVSVTDIAAAVARVLPKELATHAALESRDALEAAAGLWRGPGPPPRPIVFDPERCWAAAQVLVSLPGSGTSMQAMVPRAATAGARLYVAAVLEYMAAELLELSVDQALATSSTHGGSAKRAASGGEASADGAAVGTTAASSTSKATGAPPFLLPCHCVQALRQDDELGARTAGVAAVPFAGITYTSLLGLFSPPQPAAKKALQKKKADAALDSAWQKELRRKQREAEKARKEKEERLRKEREKEKRRAEREAARKADQERRARQQTSAAEQAAELARQKLRERLSAVVDHSGAAAGVAPPPKDLRWPARSFLCAGRCRADGCVDREVYPDIAEGGISLTCSAACCTLYHGGTCWADVRQALLAEQQHQQGVSASQMGTPQSEGGGGSRTPGTPGGPQAPSLGDDTVSEDGTGTGTAPPSEAGGELNGGAAQQWLLPRNLDCPTPGCNGIIVAATRLHSGGRTYILTPLLPAGDDESVVGTAGTPGGDGGEAVKKKKKRGSGANKLAAAEAAKAAAEAAKAAAEAAKQAAAQAAAQARAAAAAERAAAEKAAAERAAAQKAAAQAVAKAASAAAPNKAAPPAAPSHQVAGTVTSDATPAATAPSNGNNGAAKTASSAPAPAAASPGPREVPDTWEDSVAVDDEPAVSQPSSNGADAAATASPPTAPPAPALPPPPKKVVGLSSAFGAFTETLAALGLRSGSGQAEKEKKASTSAAASDGKEPSRPPAASTTSPPATKPTSPATATGDAGVSKPAQAPPKAASSSPSALPKPSHVATASPESTAAATPRPVNGANHVDSNGGGVLPASDANATKMARTPHAADTAALPLAQTQSPLVGALNALRHARRVMVTGVPSGALVSDEQQPQVRDALNASLNATWRGEGGPDSGLYVVSVTMAAITGSLFAEFATMQAVESAMEAQQRGTHTDESLIVAGAAVRLQRLRGPPPGVPALVMRQPESVVTERIDALIDRGHLQTAHITDRLWELLHLLDARTVLAALAEWPPSHGSLGAQDGALALAALCERITGVPMLDMVALPAPVTVAPVAPAVLASHSVFGKSGAPMWSAPHPQVGAPIRDAQRPHSALSAGVTSSCDPPGLHYVSAAIHRRWLMCNAALRDRWAVRRACAGCGARMLQPHKPQCVLPGVAPYAPPAMSFFHGTDGVLDQQTSGMRVASTGVGTRAELNGNDLLMMMSRSAAASQQPPVAPLGGFPVRGAASASVPIGAWAPSTAPTPPASVPPRANGGAAPILPSWSAPSQQQQQQSHLPPWLSMDSSTAVHSSTVLGSGSSQQQWPGAAMQGPQAAHHVPPPPPPLSRGSFPPAIAHQPPPPPGPPPAATVLAAAARQIPQPQIGAGGMPRVPSGSAITTPQSASPGSTGRAWGGSHQARPLGASTSASLSQQHLASGDDISPEDDEEVCPICCENIDDTDKAFFPCPCGFQPCMFCYNKIVEIGDARCPACRRTYGSPNGDEAEESSSSDDDDDDTSNSDSSSDGPAAGAKAGAAASARVTGRARK